MYVKSIQLTVKTVETYVNFPENLYVPPEWLFLKADFHIKQESIPETENKSILRIETISYVESSIDSSLRFSFPCMNSMRFLLFNFVKKSEYVFLFTDLYN